MTTQPEALRLAEEYADAVATHRLEHLYGTSRSYTLEKARGRDEAFTALNAELRRLHAENEALKKELAMEQRLSFRKQLHANADRDEALLRQVENDLHMVRGGYGKVLHEKDKARLDQAIAALRTRLGEGA